MVFTKRLREGIRRGRIRCSVRIWMRPHVKVGGRYRMEEGHIIVDAIMPIRLADITSNLARESGFSSVKDLLQTAKHGAGNKVYLIRFRYLPPGAWDVRLIRDSDFRRMALGMDGAVESAHMGHPDFRVNNRIFATLHDDREFGMVALTPDQQEQFMRAHPRAFAPENGAWGRTGSTRVRLAAIHEETLGEALTLAWQNTVNKGPSKPRKGSAKPVRRSKKR